MQSKEIELDKLSDLIQSESFILSVARNFCRMAASGTGGTRRGERPGRAGPGRRGAGRDTDAAGTTSSKATCLALKLGRVCTLVSFRLNPERD